MEKIKKMVAEICPHLVNLIVEEDKHTPNGVIIHSPNGVLIDTQVNGLAKIAESFGASWSIFPSPIKGAIFFIIDYKYKNL